MEPNGLPGFLLNLRLSAASLQGFDSELMGLSTWRCDVVFRLAGLTKCDAFDRL
jgi:hypothetical protein